MRLPRFDTEDDNLSSLLESARQGSREATGELLEAYRSYLLLVANRQLGPQLWSKGAPSDIVQDTLMDASRSLSRFEGEHAEDLLRWLRRILNNNLNTFADRYRCTEKRRLMKEESAEALAGISANEIGPGKVLLAEEHARIIRQAIASLQLSYRQALALRYRTGASYEEMAQLLNRSPDAVRKLTKRGTEELKKAIHFAGLSSVTMDLRSLVSEQIFDEAELWEVGDSSLGFVRLRQFEIVRELGSGAFGVVYLAHDTISKQEVALKVPRIHVLQTVALRNRFIREAVVLSRLEHPNLVPIYEAGQIGPICYLATAYCPGPTLGHWLQQPENSVTPAEAVGLLREIANAVDHIHGQSVLHRDIKPTNILLAPRPGVSAENLTRLDQAHPMLTDFGLAKILEDENHLTPTGLTVGTAYYMAPEQVAHSRSVGPPADVYSLGVVLYEMLTGATPEVASAILPTRTLPTRSFVPLRTIRPDVSPALEAVCHRCLEEDLELRYSSAADLMDDLSRIPE